MERILATGRDELVRLAGHGCQSGEGLVARFAFGLAGSKEIGEAQMHLATCPRCGAMYERLEVWRDKVAVLLPVPAAAGAQAHVIERAVHVGTEVLAPSPASADDGHRGVRKVLGDVVVAAREHAASLYSRSVDPTPLAGARPGAVVAAIVGCIAVGSGATYCAQQGTGPLADWAGLGGPVTHHAKSHHRRERAKAAQAPVATTAPTPPPVVTPPPVTPAPTPPPTTTQPAPSTTQAALQPTPQDQFEPTAPSSNPTAKQSSTASPTSSRTNKKPAAAPAGGAGEFGGP